MEYAIQLLLPILGGLLLGNWLTQTYHWPPIWTVLFGVLGLAMGIIVLYRQSIRSGQVPKWTPKPPSAKTASQKQPAQSVQDLDALYQHLHATQDEEVEPLEFEQELEKDLKRDDD